MATCDVRTLLNKGNLEQVICEAERLKIDVLGLAEVRAGLVLVSARRMVCKALTFHYSGGKQHMYGVGFLVSPKAANAITAVPSEWANYPSTN